jgi:hypothetical protein
MNEGDSKMNGDASISVCPAGDNHDDQGGIMSARHVIRASQSQESCKDDQCGENSSVENPHHNVTDSQETNISGSQSQDIVNVMPDSQKFLPQSSVMSQSQGTDSQATVMTDSHETVMTDSQGNVMTDSQGTVMSDLQSNVGCMPGRTEPSCSSQTDNLPSAKTKPSTISKVEESSENSQSLLPGANISDAQNTLCDLSSKDTDVNLGKSIPMILGTDSEGSQSESLLNSAGAVIHVVSHSCPGSSGDAHSQSKSDDNIQDCSLSQPSKKRKVQMDTQQCMDHMQSESGAQALVNPATVKFSSKDPNRGLYPRRNLSKSFGNGFVSAGSLNRVNLADPASQPDRCEQNMDCSISYSSPGSKQKPVLPSPSNSIFKYFSKSDGKHVGSNDAGTDLLKSPPGSQGDSGASPGLAQNKSEDSVSKHSAIESNAFTTLMAGQKSQHVPSTKKYTKGKGKTRGSSSSQKTSGSEFFWKKSSSCIDTIDLTEDCSSDDSLDIALSQSDTYGLIGEEMKNYKSPTKPRREKAQSQYEFVDYFSILPVHVIENIFSQLPMLDLCLNSNRVSLMWNDIISDEKVREITVHWAYYIKVSTLS